MVRKLALAVSLALGTLSVPAHALGLGELSSKSTLNQNFKGDITLLSVQPEELDGVRVKLADTDAFSRAGVERPFYLSLLKFEPTLGSGGKPVIRVSSEFPIREPFMNFLIEVNWPNGRLLREYTVLLDPPTTTKRRPPTVAPVAKTSQKAAAPKVSAPAVSAPKAVAAAPLPVSGVSDDGTEYGPVKANDTAWSIAKRVRPRGVSMEQMMIALLNANPQAFLDNNINRLRRGQILRVPSSAEIQQLSRQEARAAYRQQQDEWLARRDQRLQRAAESETAADTAGGDSAAAEAAAAADRLRIATARPEGSGEAGAGDDNALSPTASDLKSRLIVARENAETSRQEAETLRTQVDDLQARLADMQKLLSLKDDQLAQLQDRVVSGEAGAVSETPVADTAPEPVVVEAPPADVTLANPVEAGGEATQEVIIDGGAPADAVTTPVEEAVAEMGAALDNAAVTAAASAEAAMDDYRIADIAPQVDPDRIVLAADADGIVAEAALDGGMVAAEVPVTAETGVSEVTVIEGASPDSAAEPAVVEPMPAEPAPVMAEPAAVSPPVADSAEPTVDQAAGSGLIPKPIAAMLEQNIVPIAAGGVALLGLVGWLATRRRRTPDAGQPAVAGAAAAAAGGAAMSPPSAATAVQAVDEPALDADALADLPDSAFLDEFSPSDINALQDETGEVDPVSEADVYIAYGRYQQAEELLRQAMNRDPDRLALKHKLLEVHYATRNAEAFSALAGEMVDAGQDAVDEDAWARAQDMGRELAPDNAMFARSEDDRGITLASAAAGASAVAAAAAGSVDSDTLSLDDLELSELTAAYEEDSSGSDDLEAPSEVSITLDLDEASELNERAESSLPESIALDDFESLDFELPEAEKDGAVSGDDDQITDTLDLDSMMAEAEAAVDQDDSLMSLDSDFSADELQAQLDELSDLSVLDSGLEGQTDKSGVDAPSGLGLVAEDSGAPDDRLDVPLSLDGAFDTDDEAEELSELTGLEDAAASAEAGEEDEVATKLDLARAYVDMGDEDGARSILEEVVTEGNNVQRDDAEQLLARLG